MKTFFFWVLFLSITVCSANNIKPSETQEFVGNDSYLEGAIAVSSSNRTLTEIHIRSSLTEEEKIVTQLPGRTPSSTVDSNDIVMRPNTRIRIDWYFTQRKEKDQIAFALVRDVLRAVTGWVENLAAKDDRFTILDVTIGIRA